MSASRASADVVGALAIVGITAALAFGPRLHARLSEHPSAEECESLLERYVELKERSVTEKIDPKRYGAALEEAKRAAGPSFAACTTEVTREELSCTRRATHVDELERCLR
jgi:hypothetical protein